MRPLNTALGTSPSVLATAAATLAFPPTSLAAVDAWSGVNTSVPEFDIEIWGSTTIAVTAAEIYGASLHANAISAANIISVNTGADTVTKVGHGLVTGDGPLRFTGTGTLPSGLAVATDYWVIRVDADTFKLSTSVENALRLIPIDLGAGFTGTITYTGTAAASRVTWNALALLGLAGDGAISLTALQGYSKRLPHHPRFFAYGLTATLSAGTLSSSLYPIQSI